MIGERQKPINVNNSSKNITKPEADSILSISGFGVHKKISYCVLIEKEPLVFKLQIHRILIYHTVRNIYKISFAAVCIEYLGRIRAILSNVRI